MPRPATNFKRQSSKTVNHASYHTLRTVPANQSPLPCCHFTPQGNQTEPLTYNPAVPSNPCTLFTFTPCVLQSATPVSKSCSKQICRGVFFQTHTPNLWQAENKRTKTLPCTVFLVQWRQLTRSSSGWRIPTRSIIPSQCIMDSSFTTWSSEGGRWDRGSPINHHPSTPL